MRGKRGHLGTHPGRGARRAGAAPRVWRCRFTRRIWRGRCARPSRSRRCSARRSTRCCSARSRRCSRREAAALDPQATLAALVVDNRTREVIAYVGNADFASAARHGTLDMARAVRSPGSALKPFIYAMAFDRLIIHPQTVLDDRPRHFGDYAPGDFDGRFQGEVSARRGAAIFAQRAGRRGARSARAEPVHRRACRRRHPPAPAGSRPPSPGSRWRWAAPASSLYDLATLYVALSHGGEVPPLRPRPTIRRRAGRRSSGRRPRGTSTTSSAARRRRPGCCRPRCGAAGISPSRPGPPTVSATPGRSATIREVTIAVWAGRPDGTPMPGRSGRVTAAPVLFKIADLLGPRRRELAPSRRPASLRVADRDLPPALAPARPGAGARSARTRGRRPENPLSAGWRDRRLGRGERCRSKPPAARRPLRWLVDGRPLPPRPPRRTLYWQPGEIGFARLTVIDAAGRSARATVRLAP